MKFQLTLSDWQAIEESACFTLEQQAIVDLIKKYDNIWTQERYAEEMNMSLRTFQRRWNQIRYKIFRCI